MYYIGWRRRFNSIIFYSRGMMKNMKENQVKIIMILTVTSLILIFIGLSYAFFTANNPERSTA